MPYDPNLPPITVIVSNGQYNCFGDDTPRSLELMRILKEDLGGVAAGTPDGTYYFNVEIVEGENAYCTLEPA